MLGGGGGGLGERRRGRELGTEREREKGSYLRDKGCVRGTGPASKVLMLRHKRF